MTKTIFWGLSHPAKTAKKIISIKFQLKVFIGLVGLTVIICSGIVGVHKVITFINDPLGDIEFTQVITAKTVQAEQPNGYAYNEQVPADVIEIEIRKQAAQFNLGADKMVELAFCESGLNNLAKNETSTALGIYQYLIKTWEETESFKNKRIARTDYRANIREAMIDISNGEIWRWEDCARKVELIN